MVYKVQGLGSKKGHHTSIRYRCQKHFDSDTFIEDLEVLPWSVLDIYDDLDDALDMWSYLVESTVSQYLIWKKKWANYNKQPEWKTDNILEAISTRGKYVKDKDFDNYKLWQNKVISLIRNSK